MKTKSWFRVTVDANGKAIDCRPVGGAGTDELGVFYILAETAKQAAKTAGDAQAARLLAARRARYAAEGLCKCGRARDRKNPNGGLFKVCFACFERHQVHEDRAKARARGEEVPALDRREVLLERKQKDAASVRLETLVEVQRAYHRMRGQGATFERWLAKQVEALIGKKVA